ncbi:MAG: TonB family protein [Bacteroidaceae bacterium]|nr:TonB family protein [Bacteroidaceae bacterium]
MLYVIKAAITLALLYSCFFVFLSKETFHRFNRCMLVGIMLVSLVMPLFHFTTEHPTALNEEVYIMQNYIEHDTAPIVVTTAQATRITWIQVLMWLYLAGVAVMLILTLVQAVSLIRFMCSGIRHTDAQGNTVILHNRDVPPFSIFRYIVMSVKDYETSRPYILTHEQEHIRLGHTYDLLLLQCVKTLQWFNPFIWFLSRDLKAVHEYEADQAVINKGIDAKSYQQLLVIKVVGNRLQPFTNNLNHGSLKKRIIMMYQKPSNRWLMLKALCAIPVAALTINTFATPIETDPVEDMVKTLETKAVPTFNEVKENVLTTVESVEETPFAIHPVRDQYGRILGFSHEGTPATGDFECTSEYVFVNGRPATEAELRNYKSLMANSTFEMLKTANGTPEYDYKDKHGIIVIHTQNATAPDGDEPLVLINGKEIKLPADVKTIDGASIAKLLNLDEDAIESITVLKDAAAKAFYGDKGKNGVIEIKLKEVKEPSSLDELMEKLPGAEKHEDGTITINGKPVKKILLEGQEVYNDDDPIFDVTEEPAQYPGGQGALMQFLAQNVRYPKIAAENGVQGRVLVQFVIEKNGSCSNYKIVRSATKDIKDAVLTVTAQNGKKDAEAEKNAQTEQEAREALDAEALRVLHAMPNWIPAKQRGQEVRMRYTLPITFRLQ